MKKNNKIIISGGGTGGHIFPALAIADELKRRDAGNEILFVGATGRMEMEKIPAAGYKIIGLPVRGFNRKNIFANIGTILRLMQSAKKAKDIISDFKPDIAVGVGGYASGPLLRAAGRKGIPTILQEQNSYAGVTNRLLAKRAAKICVAYHGMEKYFPPHKIVVTGNPVRKDLTLTLNKNPRALEYFKIDPGKKVLLVLGGSLGARTINHAIRNNLHFLAENNSVEVIWQTGKIYYEDSLVSVKDAAFQNIKLFDFINRMDLAYSVADVIISRAGACTISELCIVGKPVILVPSPNVAEDHQTKNAMAVAGNGAGMMIADSEAGVRLVNEALELIKNKPKMQELGNNIKKMALENATEKIADEIYKFL
ncbi:MAG: undecaprenyldiphospho-muramoylpentapeptide beta-N-acetylglucosaminyltransferase [Bacteroidales bacterium]|nr:undecaprenyldiphospho-muramoylpentapeptide beta-N-acetylglucosaminyltransferase [Bacteroidales bacterium]